ncbi:MAG: hypothetical protein QM726_07935 [Chitinophagaceae bacterium]
MKKTHFIAIVIAGSFMYMACGNNSANTSTTGDTTISGRNDSMGTVIPPPDNSAATNPSLADTNYSKNHDSLAVKKDSSKH